MACKLKAQFVDLVAANDQRVLSGKGPVMQTLRRGAGEGVFTEILIGRALLNATHEARAGAAMQCELLVVRQLMVDAERVNLRTLRRDGKVADQTVERDERRWQHLA